MLGAVDTRRAMFYRQLAGLEEAGLPIRQALKLLQPSDRTLRGIHQHLVAEVAVGTDLGAACATAPGMRPFERQIVAAAAQIGSLPDAWRELAEHFEARASAKRELMGQLLYPAIVLHAAIVLPPVYLLFTQGLASYLRVVGLGLGLVWGLVVLSLALRRILRDSIAMDLFLWYLPGVAGVYRLEAQRTALSVLRGAMGAGLMADASFRAAAGACSSVLLRRQLGAAAEAARTGDDLPDIVRGLTLLPVAVRDGMAAGAAVGNLPEVLRRLERDMSEEAKVRRRVLITLISVGFFLLVALLVAIVVIRLMQGYVDGLNDLM